VIEQCTLQRVSEGPDKKKINCNQAQGDCGPELSGNIFILKRCVSILGKRNKTVLSTSYLKCIMSVKQFNYLAISVPQLSCDRLSSWQEAKLQGK
jgi:hypothetical protein